MTPDSIIDELNQVREQLAKEYNYDVFAIVADVRARQAHTGHPVVSFTHSQTVLAATAIVEDKPERRAA